MDQIPDSQSANSEKLKSTVSNLLQMVKDYSSENPIFFLFILLMLPVTLLTVQQTVNYLSKAQGTDLQYTITFSPTSLSLPPDSDFKIILSSQTKKVAFARVVVKYDPTKVRLTGTITTNPNLSTVVEKTDITTANSQGKVVIVIAASPTDTQPQGQIELASLRFSASSQINDTAIISFDDQDMQIVESTGTELSVNSVQAQVNLNSGQQNTSNPTPTISLSASLPAEPCSNKSSAHCFEQWKREYTGVDNTKKSDLDNNGMIDLVDFEIWRQAAYP